MPNIAILGIGNILMQDDGAGVEVVKRLEQLDWPENISFIDGGTAVLSLLDVFINNQKIIVVDTLKGGHQPGTVYRLTPEQLGEWKKESLSLHDVQVLDVMRMAALFNSYPEVIIYGIEPYIIEMELGLSEPMLARLPALLECVRREIEGLLAQSGCRQMGDGCCA